VLNERELSAAIGSTAYDADGDKIGTVEHFFADDRTGTPTWVAVATGLFGTRHSVVPASGATFADGALRLPVRKETVRDAPRPADAARLDPASEAELRRHYGLVPTAQPAPSDLPPGAQPPGAQPPGAQPPLHEEATGRHAALQDDGPRPGVATDTGTVPVAAVAPAPPVAPVEPVAPSAPVAPAGAGDGSMTRSEEQLRVSTQRVVSGRVRVVKYVVTEEVQVTVPIRREEIRLEELPASGGDVPLGTGESLLPPSAEHLPGTGLPEEIVLHAERPVVGVEVVPVERVRLSTVTVTDQEQVTERVQREQVVVDES
jgi:uncharacterized protein (TIGR02271 family)